MSAHTPGPWRWADCGDLVSDTGNTILYPDRDDVAICRYREADAALIAAAPDLLQALELCLARDSALRFNVTVMSAIAKARGES